MGGSTPGGGARERFTVTGPANLQLKKMNILLINPWIYDFAAYDLWLKPWGLLKISSILKNKKQKIYFIDAMDRHHVKIQKAPKDHSDGTGKYLSSKIEKPSVLKKVPRKLKRYGLPVDIFLQSLPEEKPDYILVSSGMTYWYLGVFETIRMLREKYKNVPVILGGIYATLCSEHAAEKSGADYVVGNKDLGRLNEILDLECDFSFQNILDTPIDYSPYKNPGYGVLRISLGCPFNCSYCAQEKLSPKFILKDKNAALEEIKALYNSGIRKFAFYDDALLFNQPYIKWYFESICKMGIKAEFYTPNGLNARFVSEEIALLMKKIGVINPFVSLETIDEEEITSWHTKVTKDEFEKAVANLKKAGYKKGEYTVYLMIGAPGSSLEGVKKGIDFSHSLGARVSLSEFSPIPGTKMAQNMDKTLFDEPLLQNNSVFPSFRMSEWEEVQRIKINTRKLNSSLVR